MRATRTCHLLLFLFTCTEAQTVLIKNATLFVHPATEVERGTNLTLTCNAIVMHGSGRLPQYTYSFYKDFVPKAVHMLTTDAVEQVNYFIPDARVFHSGKYKCEVVIDGQIKKSVFKEITVKGLQAPELIVDKLEVSEGEAVSATCMAEGEKGTLSFSFKDGSEEVHREETSISHVQKTLQFDSRKTARLSCSYSINIGGRPIHSNVSNMIDVKVQELDIKPTITFQLSTEVVEGDSVSISCSVNPNSQDSPSLSLQLAKGTRILKADMKKNNYSNIVRAEDAGEYECSAQMNNVQKNSVADLTVKELFSWPVLTIMPAKVFEMETFTVTCKSSDFAAERINRDDVKYSIHRNGELVTPGAFDGTYRATAGTHTNGNYTCNAQAKMITKETQPQIFIAKVLVSRPLIKVVHPVVLGHSFWIYCNSENGSFPINYTLIRNGRQINQTLVTNQYVQATFPAIISSENEIHEFRCKAQNSPHVPPLTSEALSAPVIVPVEKALLTVLPAPGEVTEGQNVTLICSISKGTPPISFRWYRSDRNGPLRSDTVKTNFSSHTLYAVSNENSGSYYCEALNNGTVPAPSNEVTFTVRMARWKKGLIGGVCLLCLAVTVIVVVVRYRSKRVGVFHSGQAGVWSQRPPHTDVEDELNVEYTEVLHPQADPTRVPLKKGTDTVYSELQTPSQGFVGVC